VLFCVTAVAIGQIYIVTDLVTLPGGSYTVATAMNDAGQVVGYGNTADGETHAFLWDARYGMRDLGTLGGTISQAFRIDNTGHVGGHSTDANDDDQQFIYFDANNNGQVDPGEMQVGTLSGPTIPDVSGCFDSQIAYSVVATDVNDSGYVVGSYCPQYGCGAQTHAFLVSDCVVYDLGTFGWGTSAVAINNFDQVVGNGCTLAFGSCGVRKSFLYSDGTFIDLATLIPGDSGLGTTIVSDINNHGQIAGYGCFNGVCYHAFLLSLFRLADAQGFEPQFTDGVATLQTPITTAVDSSFERVGALTDGASLIVVQFASEANLDGWIVSLVDTDNVGFGAAELGSLWHGDNTSLPPLPVTTNDLGSASLTLTQSETAVFYRAAPGWAFGTTNKTHDIQIQVFDPDNNLVATSTFTLHKPPLVLVHGWTGNPGDWDGFPAVLANAGIQVDAPFRADYAVSNTCGIDVVFDAVPKAISNTVRQLRTDGVAATRVDVIAHSYGGIITRWYMTPSSQLPDGQSRTNDASPIPLFKTTTIKGARSAELEFMRPDNFGIGDIRRFITLGVPHTGTSAAWKAIQILNLWVSRKAERNREILNDWMSLERTLSTPNHDFRAIGLNEAGTPTEFGMSIIDAAAFGTHPTTGTCGSCPDVSLALASLPAIPVEYLPVEGTALGSNPFWNALVWIGQRAILHGVPPSDIKPSVSDGFIPALSARNRTARPDPDPYNLIGVNHSQLTSTLSLGPILVDALGDDDSIFLGP
jgi:probable HAF family extracellular repeat protein